jgi:hypothetical protein
MTLLAACAPPAPNVVPIAVGDRVRVPDGRMGRVIGFYRCEDETVLVQLDAGGSERYIPTDVFPLR